MASTDQSYDTVLIGKVVGLHALKGEVRVLPYGDIDWIAGESLYMVPKGKRPPKDAVPVKVLFVRPHKGVVLVTFAGIERIEEAKSLLGLDLYIDADRLPELEPGEYYHSDLLEMEVLDPDGKSLGRIKEVITTGGNDVYQILGPDGETLLPAIKEVIVSVDVANKKMVVKPLDYEHDMPEDEI